MVWLSGDVAVKYKADLVNALKPDVIIGVQTQDELAPLIASLETPVIIVEPSFALKPRTPEKRKILREMTYARYLKNAKLQCIPKSQVTIEPRNAIPKNQEPEKGILVGLYGRGCQVFRNRCACVRLINFEKRSKFKLQFQLNL